MAASAYLTRLAAKRSATAHECSDLAVRLLGLRVARHAGSASSESQPAAPLVYSTVPYISYRTLQQLRVADSTLLVNFAQTDTWPLRQLRVVVPALLTVLREPDQRHA